MISSGNSFGFYNQERPKNFGCSSHFDDHVNLVNDESEDLSESVEMNPDVIVGNELFPVRTDLSPVRNDTSQVIMDKIEDCFDLYNSPRPRCPSFTCQLNEQLSGNIIEHYFITDEMISNAAKFAAQIACVNLSYSTYIPSSSSDPSVHHCCPICQRSLLLAVSQFFYNNNMDDIHDLSPGMPINPSTPKFAATLQVQQGMEHSLTKILQSLRAVLHIRPTELIHALHYFDVLLKRHWMCSTFILFRQSLKTIFAVCCLIAHKMNSDNPFRNTAWSELFGMPIQTINEFERSILTLLEYETRLSEDRYHQFEAIVGVGEDYFITLGACAEAEAEAEARARARARSATTTVATSGIQTGVEVEAEVEEEAEGEREVEMKVEAGACGEACIYTTSGNANACGRADVCTRGDVRTGRSERESSEAGGGYVGAGMGMNALPEMCL